MVHVLLGSFTCLHVLKSYPNEMPGCVTEVAWRGGTWTRASAFARMVKWFTAVTFRKCGPLPVYMASLHLDRMPQSPKPASQVRGRDMDQFSLGGLKGSERWMANYWIGVWMAQVWTSVYQSHSGSDHQ